MKIDICCVGKVKESSFREMINEYTKRLSRYANVNIKEVADEKTPDNASSAEEEIIKNKEGARLLNVLKDDSYKRRFKEIIEVSVQDSKKLKKTNKS